MTTNQNTTARGQEIRTELGDYAGALIGYVRQDESGRWIAYRTDWDDYTTDSPAVIEIKRAFRSQESATAEVHRLFAKWVAKQ